MVASGAWLGLLVGIASVAAWRGATTGNVGVVRYALLFAAMLGLPLIHGLLLYRAPARRRGRPVTRSVRHPWSSGDRQYTVLPDATGIFAVLAVLMGVIGTLPAMMAVDYYRGGLAAPGTVTAIAALLWSSYLVEVAVGRLSVGAVALGTDGIYQRGRSFEAFLLWGDVDRVALTAVNAPVVKVIGYANGALEQRRTSRWKIDRTTGIVMIEVDAGNSSLPPWLLAAVLAFYAENPQARAELGTPAALARIATWRQP